MEGPLADLSSVRAAAFFSWHSQTFSGRWVRRLTVAFLAFVLPILYAVHRTFATRVLHTLLRRVTRDRLDLLGEEYFQYVVKPRLKPRGVEALHQARARGEQVVLVSHSLEHVVRPLAQHLGVTSIIANRLEFRDRAATGRLLEPVVPPRGLIGRPLFSPAEGRIAPEKLAARLGIPKSVPTLEEAVVPAARRVEPPRHAAVLFEPHRKVSELSVRKALQGKNILLIGCTGFIGKVWLAKALWDLPELGKVYLLIRRQRTASALRRFEKIIEESPLFEPFHERYGSRLADFLRERVEVVEGDVTRPGLGLEPDVRARLEKELDLIINSAGLTDFNPDLRTALAINVDGTVHLLDFLRGCPRAALLHLSTCYVIGARDGRVTEELQPDYTPARAPDFDPELEHESLRALVRQIEERAAGADVTEDLRRLAREKSGTKKLAGDALESHVGKYRTRWLRNQMVEAGLRRARELGWPNTYTFTKSLAESLILRRGGDLPVTIVRPSIVESSIEHPFRGWNEGVNTSAPLSYLLGTFFRQLPSNERKCLDLIPVDLVCRGMFLISAALAQRRHERLYQLATSACNPCDMGRSIELTCLAHRKHYRAQEGLEHWLRAQFDTIPVSKERYRKFSAPGQKAVVRALRRASPPLRFVQGPLMKRERDLERVEKLIELYEPFILHNEHVFEALNVEILSAALPPEERAAFGYDAHSIDWWEYWINIHVPALRKWSYPLIEGRPLESRPKRTFYLYSEASGRDAAEARAAG